MKSLFTFSFVFLSFAMHAQLFDSTRVGVVTGNANTFFDTVLTISRYHSFSENGKDDFGIINLGNQGDVRRELIFKNNFELGPYFGIDGYFKNYSSAHDVSYYNVKAASSGVRYLSGYSRGQLFGVDFTINPISRFNVFIDYQRVNARGNYFNQENKSDNLKFSTSYYSKEGVYQFNAGISWNKFQNIEYGGIADVEAFESNTLSNRELIPVNLLSSTSKVRSTDISVQQSLRLFNFNESDVRLYYDLDVLDQYVVFRSSDSIFTDNALFDAVDGISDSIYFRKWKNNAGLSWSISGQELRAGLVHYYHDYGNEYFTQAQNNFGLNGAYSLQLNRIHLSAFGEFLLTENYKGNYNLNIDAFYNIDSLTNLVFHVSNKKVNPGLIQGRYISNNFVWANDFSPVDSWSGFIKAKTKLLEVKVGGDVLTNFVYFNQQAIPAQNNGTLGIYYGEINANIHLFGPMYLDNRARYQYTDTESIIRLPNWVLRHVLYFEDDLFKGHARLQTGIEFKYFSSFLSEAYMPAFTEMYLQDEIRIGNFPYFNFLVNFKIKDFTFFVRLENITQGLFEYNYYAAPLYPMPDFSFRFGGTWRFFN